MTRAAGNREHVSDNDRYDNIRNYIKKCHHDFFVVFLLCRGCKPR